jgi:transposase
MNILNLVNVDILKVEESKYDFIITAKAKYKPYGCEKCWKADANQIHKHGSRERMIRDINYQNKRVGIKFTHQRYKCQVCGQTFYQMLDFVDKDCKMTWRLYEYIREQAIRKPFSQIAEELGLSHTIVRDIFKEFIADNEDKKVIIAPKVLGIDEAHLNKVMRGVFTNVEANQIIEMTPTRSKKEVIKFMKSMEGYENIEVVTTDMWRPYIDAAYETIPNVAVVIDRYHVVKCAVAALDTIRKQFKNSLNKNEARQLMRDRKVLLSNEEDLHSFQITLRDKWFSLFPTLKDAYYLKEDFRKLYNSSSRAEAEELFDIWCSCIDADFKPFLEVAKMVMAFRKEIFNYFDYKYTNAFTESTNDIIKLIEKNGRGYSFEVLRAKVLFGSRATKKPKFGTGEFMQIERMLNNYAEINKFWDESEDEVKSFGVDIPTLREVLLNGEF